MPLPVIVHCSLLQVLAWVSSEIQQGIYQGILNPTCQVAALDNCCRLRASMAAFHDQVRASRLMRPFGHPSVSMSKEERGLAGCGRGPMGRDDGVRGGELGIGLDGVEWGGAGRAEPRWGEVG